MEILIQTCRLTLKARALSKTFINCLSILSMLSLWLLTGLAQQQEQFTVNSAPERLVFGPIPKGMTAKTISSALPDPATCATDSPTQLSAKLSILFKPDGLSQAQFKTALGDGGLNVLSSDTRNGQKVVTIVHILRWADKEHSTVAFQNWYKYDPARRYGWTYVKHGGLDISSTFIGGKKEFRLVYIHLDSQACGNPESFDPTNTNALLKKYAYSVKIQKQQSPLSQDASSLLTILSPLGTISEAGYYSIFEFHSNFVNSTITISASLDTSAKQSAPQTATVPTTAGPLEALGNAAKAISDASTLPAGPVADAQKKALDAAAKAVAAASGTLNGFTSCQSTNAKSAALPGTPALTDSASAVRNSISAACANSLSDQQKKALSAAADALVSAAAAFIVTATSELQMPDAMPSPAEFASRWTGSGSVHLVSAAFFQAAGGGQPKKGGSDTSAASPAKAAANPASPAPAATAANGIASQSFTNQPLQWIALGVAVPVRSYRDLSYNSSGGNFQAQTVNRQNVYVTANFFYPKAEYGQTTFRWLPSPMFGMPIKGQPLRNTLYGFSVGWRWFQPFWGMVLDVQQQETAGSIHNRYVRKGVYGLTISISALATKLAGK